MGILFAVSSRAASLSRDVSDRRTVQHRLARIAGILAAATLLGIDPRSSPWEATALCVVVAGASYVAYAGTLRPKWRPPAPWIFRAVVVAVTVWSVAPLLAGHMPATRDHPIHYLRAHILVHDLLPAGRLVGFSQRIGLGVGLGDDYPVLPTLWAAAAHLGTFGAVNLRASYALGIAAMFGLSAAAAYGLARAVIRGAFRSLRPWSVALGASVAALGCLLDPGGSREGGWEYAAFHGVWPQALSVPFVLLFLTYLLSDAGRLRRRMALAGLAGALAVLAHPFALPPLFAAALAASLVRLAARDTLVRCAAPWLAFGLAAAGAAVWLGPFVEHAGALDRHPVPWHPLALLASDLLRGRLLDHGGAGYLAPAATVGLGLLAVSGGRAGRTLVLVVAGLLVAASTDLVAVFRADLLLPQLRTLQFPRFALYLTPLLTAAAGAAIAWAADRLARYRPAPAADASRHAAATAALPIAVAAAVLVAGLFTAGPALVRRPAAAVDTLEGDPLAHADAALRARLDAFAREHGRPPTVAFLRAGLSGATYPLLAAADAGARILLFGHVPTINRRTDLRRPEPSLLDRLGADFVVYDGPLPRKHPLRERIEAVEPIERVESLRIVPWTPERAHRPRPPEPVVTPLDPAAGRFRIEIPDDRTHVTVPLTPHPALVVRQGDRLVSPTRDPVERGAAFFLGLDEVGPGPVLVRFEPARHGVAYATTSALAVLVCLLAFAPWRVPQRLAALAAGRPGPRSGAVLAALAFVAFAAAHRRAGRQLAASWEDTTRAPETDRGIRPPGDDERPPPTGRFVADLVLAGDAEILARPADPCRALAGRDPRRGCSPALEAPRRSFLSHGRRLYRCLRVTIAAGGFVRLRLPVPPADRLVALVHRVRGRGKRLRFRVPALHAKARPLTRERTVLKIPRARAGDDLELRFANRDKKPATVCVAAAAFDDRAADGT